MFFLLKDSVAARKMETSCLWPLRSFEEVVRRGVDMLSSAELVDGIAFGSQLDVFMAGPESCVGDGGGVG